jgi:hypothetical protein
VSSGPIDGPGGPDAAAGHSGQPSQEELRAAYEAELSRITSTDMMLQAAVSLLNIGGHRLGTSAGGAGSADAPGGAAGAGDAAGAQRDLEQVRDAIDAVRALLEILERRHPAELRPLRDALSQLQIAYAREARAGAGEGAAGQPRGAEPGAAEKDAPGEREGLGGPGEHGEKDPKGPGPAEASGRLWVPGR